MLQVFFLIGEHLLKFPRLGFCHLIIPDKFLYQHLPMLHRGWLQLKLGTDFVGMVGFEPTQPEGRGFTDLPSSPTLTHTLLEITLEFIKSPQVISRQSVHAGVIGLEPTIFCLTAVAYTT